MPETRLGNFTFEHHSLAKWNQSSCCYVSVYFSNRARRD